jgi:thioredoxin 1
MGNIERGITMNKNTLVLTEETFKGTIDSGVTLVDFYADWCMPCRMLAPTIYAIADEYEGKVKVAKLNIDEAQGIAAEYGVMSIPTVIVFKDGKKVSQQVGMANKSAYQKMIEDAK